MNFVATISPRATVRPSVAVPLLPESSPFRDDSCHSAH